MFRLYFNRVQGRAVKLLDNKLEVLVDQFKNDLENFSLSQEEEKELANLWETNRTNNDELNKIHHRYVKRVEIDLINPLYNKIHHFRLYTIFLNQADYNQFLLSTTRLIDSIWSTVNNLSVTLIRLKLLEFEESKLAAAEAARNTNAFGRTIEE